MVKLDILCSGYFLSTRIYFSTVLLAENPPNGRGGRKLRRYSRSLEISSVLGKVKNWERFGELKNVDLLCSCLLACVITYVIVSDLCFLTSIKSIS